MGARWSVAVVVAVACCLPACNMDLALFDEPITLPTMSCLEASAWRIGGFSAADTSDGSVAILPRGHSRRLFVYPVGGIIVDCDEAVVSVRWASTRSDVAELREEGDPPRWAWLTGRTLGETSVSADVTLSDGRALTARLTVGGDELPVRVVSPLDPSVGRRVLIEGTVDLEPENTGRNPAARAYLVFDVPEPGMLNMNVDWESVGNDVIAHLCPGETDSGCVPIIDGNRFRGRKPVSASTQITPGVHTLWITNGGPEAETVRYQVGLIPD